VSDEQKTMIKTTCYALGTIFRALGQGIERVGIFVQPPSTRVVDELSQHRRLVSINNKKPKFGVYTFVAPNATVIGGPEIGSNSAIWYGVTIRGEKDLVKIGDKVSIGDRSVVHVPTGTHAKETIIADGVTIGASSVVTGCSVEAGAFIDEACLILEGAKIGANARVGPKSVVLPETVIPAGQYWAGNPAIFLRVLTPEEIEEQTEAATYNIRLAERHDYWHSLTSQQRLELYDTTPSFQPKPKPEYF